MAITGNIQPRLSKKSSSDLESLVEFDLNIIEQLDKVSEMGLKHADDSGNMGLKPRNLSDMKRKLTESRNYFRERTKFIGGVKNV